MPSRNHPTEEDRKVSTIPQAITVPKETGKNASRTSFKNATRLQESLTAAAEKRVLMWMAEHTPLAVNSDHLTLLGFLSMFCAGVSYASVHWNRVGLLFATLFLAVNWLGDSLDGTLARVRNRQRPRYGFYVDHIIDSFGATFLLGGLALSGILHWQIAAAMLVSFLLLSIETYLATYTLGVFQLSFARFGPTELRLLLALGNTVLWFRPHVEVNALHLGIFDVGGLIGAVGMAAMAIFAAIRHTAQLYNEERLI
jgi:archaetidylinositol phosphate synthase